jgi:hypothetical protein
VKTKTKTTLVTVIFVACLTLAGVFAYPVSLFVGTYLSVRETDRRTANLLYETDHKALLAVCREVMRNPSKYGTNPNVLGADSVDRFYPDPRDPNMPSVIRALQPAYIVAEDSHVRIELGGGFHHYGVNAYAEGTQGNGDKRLLDGLWYYDEGFQECPNDWEEKLEALRPKQGSV